MTYGSQPRFKLELGLLFMRNTKAGQRRDTHFCMPKEEVEVPQCMSCNRYVHISSNLTCTQCCAVNKAGFAAADGDSCIS
mmetsp:Transcript_79387/g.157303  ORF Transcript_79387/g.157303 Transcript_79387/m.157303 type:complete len:80 (-) Transcript_79387:39-278(-)